MQLSYYRHICLIPNSLTVPSSILPSSSAFVDLPSPPAVSSISMEPTGQTDHDVLTSIPVLATVDSSILATTDVHSVLLDRVGNFNPYIDRVQPFLKGVITRASVIKATHILQQHNCPFQPVNLVPPEEWASFLSLTSTNFFGHDFVKIYPTARCFRPHCMETGDVTLLL